MLIPVILSGGVGSRLWPLSREHYPKQLIALIGHYSLLQNTIKRLQGLLDQSAPIMVCNEHHRFLVAEQLRQIQVTPMHIILEPFGRNTAPAVAVAAIAAFSENPEAILLVLPADHLITDTQAFREAVSAGIELAQADYLVTFGVVPNRAETGYGYIKATQTIENTQALSIERFIEKPDRETAQNYLDSSDYYWNSGMFLFKATQYLSELQKIAPDIFTACQHALNSAEHDKDFLRLNELEFAVCP
ncbi:MAG: sugar phosphate nucleotidyltransferase, partial [Pseudomonadota bacterium]|nr:sugar phosphate nucleotidyltransferase [Pseudomonadota bacterium]